jgi:hypothetical protein
MKRALVLLALTAGCIPSTGGNFVAFHAEASGDPDVVNGAALTFTTPRGAVVTLTRAKLTVGAVYLNQQNPSNYALEQSCVQRSIYTGEVRGGLTVDALSPAAQPFPVEGNGTDAATHTVELWLTGGDLTAAEDDTVVLDVAGTATQGVDTFPFEGQFTIGSNRAIPPRNPALPSSNPICRQRIVSPIAFDTSLREGSTLSLRVDPRAWFVAVDFSGLTQVSSSPLLYRFTDDSGSSAEPDKALYNGLRSASGPYRFELR